MKDDWKLGRGWELKVDWNFVGFELKIGWKFVGCELRVGWKFVGCVKNVGWKLDIGWKFETGWELKVGWKFENELKVGAKLPPCKPKSCLEVWRTGNREDKCPFGLIGVLRSSVGSSESVIVLLIGWSLTMGWEHPRKSKMKNRIRGFILTFTA